MLDSYIEITKRKVARIMPHEGSTTKIKSRYHWIWRWLARPSECLVWPVTFRVLHENSAPTLYVSVGGWTASSTISAKIWSRKEGKFKNGYTQMDLHVWTMQVFPCMKKAQNLKFHTFSVGTIISASWHRLKMPNTKLALHKVMKWRLAICSLWYNIQYIT